MGPPTLHDPGPALHETYGLTHEEWRWSRSSSANGRDEPARHLPDRSTVEDVLSSRMIAYPFRFCSVASSPDGGGALILTTADAPRTSRQGRFTSSARRECRNADGQQMADFNLVARPFRIAGAKAFRGIRIAPRMSTSDDLRRLRASADLTASKTSVSASRAKLPGSIWDRNTAPGGKLPLNTKWRGSSMHSGMYGMYALQESVRQNARHRPGPGAGARISICHGVGGMFARKRHDHHGNEGFLTVTFPLVRSSVQALDRYSLKGPCRPTPPNAPIGSVTKPGILPRGHFADRTGP